MSSKASTQALLKGGTLCQAAEKLASLELKAVFQSKTGMRDQS